MFNNVVEIANNYINQIVKKGHITVDATCGNGHDTLRLSSLTGESGKVYGFDIQQKAVENTIALLNDSAEHKNYEVNCCSHEDILNYVSDKIDFAIFNLGYLPNADKSVTTKANSTIKCLEDIISNLSKKKTVIMLLAYLKHDDFMEYKEVKSYLSKLDVKKYNVVEMCHFARHEDSPRILIVESLV